MPNENDSKLVTLADLGVAYNDLNTNKKGVQTAVADPTASGTAVSFIDSISQNTQGVISATKKTVAEATTSASGLMSSTDKSKLDGIASGAQVNSITGVKGDAENDYRTGNVNLTPANIGAVAASAIANNLTTTTEGSVLDATQGKNLFDKIKNSIIAETTARTISESTASYNLSGLTENHIVVYWQFSEGYSENNPPGNITVETSSGMYTITGSNLTDSGITMQPVFIAPQS